MNRRCLRGQLAAVCVIGTVITLSEPAAFLDQQVALLALGCSDSQSKLEAVKVVLPANAAGIPLTYVPQVSIPYRIPTRRFRGGHLL